MRYNRGPRKVGSGWTQCQCLIDGEWSSAPVALALFKARTSSNIRPDCQAASARRTGHRQTPILPALVPVGPVFFVIDVPAVESLTDAKLLSVTL